MTREIKFRAWDKSNKLFTDKFLITDNGFAIDWYDSGELGNQNKNLVLMQFTGLKDKNGKEIFEGDIVKAEWHWEEAHEIVWPDDYYDFVEYGLSNDELEVIGNIYENPELINPK